MLHDKEIKHVMNNGNGTHKQKKAGIRPFQREDLPQIVVLLGKLFHRSKEPMPDIKEEILSELLLNNPWTDNRMPSLVYEDKHGFITGFLGVAPRDMKIEDRKINAAISYNLMVDPEKRSSLAAIGLVKQFMAGPQDVSFTDSATDTSRLLWERLGGTTVPLYSIYWRHPFRPASFANYYLRRRSQFELLARAAAPVARLGDRVISRFWDGFRHSVEVSGLVVREASDEVLAEWIESFAQGKTFRPVYSTDNLGWILDMAAKPRRFGELKKEAVYEDGDQMAGWFIYYKNPGGVSEVLQMQAKPGKEQQVLTMLVNRVRQQGAVGIAGRLEPEWSATVPNTLSCIYSPGRVWMLAHSNDKEIIQAFKGGNAFITRLEGDMWLL